MSVVVQRAPERISDWEIGRGGLIVGACILAGQALGFVRQVAIAYLLGTGPQADALSVAFAPVDLCWAALTTTIVFGFGPMLVGEDRKVVFGDLVRLTVWSGLITGAVFVALAGPVVRVLAPGLGPETAEMALGLMRISALALPALSVSTLFAALLYSERRFVFATLHRGVVNIATIAGAVTLDTVFGAAAFASGYVAGAWLQLAGAVVICRPTLRRRALAREGADLRQLSGPPAYVLLYAILIALNPVVTRALASTFGSGSTAAFDYCLKLTGVPLALIVNSVSSSMLSEIARFRFREDRRIAIRAIARASAATAILSASVTAAVLLLAPRLVALLFERGEFGVDSTRIVSSILYGFYPVLVTWSALDVISRAMFTLGMPRAPVLAAGVALLTNALLTATAPIGSLGWVGLPAVAGFLVAAVFVTLHLARLWRGEGVAA